MLLSHGVPIESATREPFSFRLEESRKFSWCRQAPPYRCESLGDVILMGDRTSNDESRGLSIRDRRFCIRYPFAADVVILDLETGTKSEGVTSDLSMGGIFVCTSKPLPSNTRVRITLTRKDQKLEALGTVRIVKPRIGMGIEFLDLEQPHYGVLRRWVEQLSKSR